MQTTLKNLIAAYLGESQARNRYSFYASVAKKEGFEQIAEIFTTTAEQEKRHAKTLYELIVKLNKESDTPTQVALPMEMEIPVVLGTTIDNLKASIAGEHEEFSTMYPSFADTAESEGFADIALKLRAIAHAEEHHKQNFEKLLALLEAGTFFTGRGAQVRVCRECGYMVVGESAPTVCPSCAHPQSYFERLQNDY